MITDDDSAESASELDVVDVSICSIRSGRATVLIESEFPDQFGRFSIERELGLGGFGVVYLAEDPLLKRKVSAEAAEDRDCVRHGELEAIFPQGAGGRG